MKVIEINFEVIFEIRLKPLTSSLTSSGLQNHLDAGRKIEKKIPTRVAIQLWCVRLFGMEIYHF